MAAGKLDAIQAKAKAAVGKAASEYAERNRYKAASEAQKKFADKDGVVRPKLPRGFISKLVTSEVSPGALFDALVDDLHAQFGE